MQFLRLFVLADSQKTTKSQQKCNLQLEYSCQDAHTEWMANVCTCVCVHTLSSMVCSTCLHTFACCICHSCISKGTTGDCLMHTQEHSLRCCQVTNSVATNSSQQSRCGSVLLTGSRCPAEENPVAVAASGCIWAHSRVTDPKQAA